MNKIKFFIKQIGKMAIQHIYLPLLYKRYSHCMIEEKSVIFADAHHNSVPFSMKKMHECVSMLDGVKVYDMFYDFQKCGMIGLIKWMKKFMKIYAKAEYVFICDNFLPVSACKKRKETKVIQLWHAGGIMKKAGYDAKDAVPEMYIGNVFANYNLWTVSSPNCVPVIENSMHQPKGVVQATGISRTDIYYDEEYNARCRAEFYAEYPDAKGKKIVVWAPTFRGNAGDPQLCGEVEIDNAFEQLENCFLVKKLHPHFENKNPEKVTCDIPSEKLFPVADLLITDYSSIVFDYLIYQKPFVLFAPDLDKYLQNHGCYIPYDSYPATVAKTSEELVDGIKYELNYREQSDLKECFDYHMGSCDGSSTERILKNIGLI